MNRLTRYRIETFERRLEAMEPQQQWFLRGKLDSMFDRAIKRAEAARRRDERARRKEARGRETA